MDRRKLRELEEELLPLVAKCEDDGHEIKYNLREAFPGISSTSYIIEIYAGFDNQTCSEIRSYFLKLLLKTTKEVTWKKIFLINILEGEEKDYYKEQKKEQELANFNCNPPQCPCNIPINNNILLPNE